MSAIEMIRNLFRPTPAPKPKLVLVTRSRDDDETASHVLRGVAHEVTTASRAASHTLRAKAVGLAYEADQARLSLFPQEPERP
jgi:hypothetical protein